MNSTFFAPLCAALLAAVPGLATAQMAIPAPADTARPYKYEFGLTASPQLDHFFTANRSLPIGLIYKQRLTPTKSLRLRLVGLFTYADSTNFKDDIFDTVNGYVTGPSYRKWQLQVFAGYEWQRMLGRRVSLYYGVEVGLGYQRQGFSSAYRAPYPPGGFGIDYYERTTQDWQVQIRSFVGINYHIMRRLCMFAETALPLSYTHQRSTYHVRETFTKFDEVDRFLDERTQANRVALT
ncbi:hypothetical protein [Hymenobacter siberiensis]|uniref:hypothetical protein n=1 Tax=Hymenobacter siberiensis TaxID=2848396 RepID=UPI001C1E210D|nr:hypothetical protein [Hymenobacter siberiensis]